MELSGVDRGPTRGGKNLAGHVWQGGLAAAKLQGVPGGYAALRLVLMQKPRALGAAGEKVVNW